MEFFDKLGRKASEAYKYTADKTGKLAKETKLKLKMGELKGEVNDLYQEIGKKVYEKHVREENIEIKGELEELCTKIDVVSDEIENLLKQCIELRDKKQCQECHTEIEKDDKYCRECGAKQEEQISELEEDIEQQKEEELSKEGAMHQEENGNMISNIEKTTEVEIDSKLNGDESEKEIVENFMESEKEDSEIDFQDDEIDDLDE